MAKIYWAIHGYPPRQNAGAEWMAKEINDYLETQGHEIRIYSPGDSWQTDIALWGADVVITHLDMSEEVTRWCNASMIHCINVVHHSFNIPHLNLSNYLPGYVRVVYNSQWIHDKMAYPISSMVVRPPVNPSRFLYADFKPDRYITLVNCNKDKGALIFNEIARTMPRQQFLAVKGHHGPQITLKGRNITQIEPVDDICGVLNNTSLLLVPSIYESYGRIAIEAMACGIPVIAHRTPGLEEALEGTDARLIKSRDHVPAWVENIHRVLRSTDPLRDANQRIKVINDKWKHSLVELENLNQLIIKLCKY